MYGTRVAHLFQKESELVDLLTDGVSKVGEVHGGPGDLGESW